MNTNLWKQNGDLYIWRYEGNPKNYSGWHFTCNIDGGNSLIQLIDLLNVSKVNSKRTINISKPRKVELAVPNCNCKAISNERLVLSILHENPNNWELHEESNKTLLTLGKNQLNKVKEGVLDVLRGKGDYSIGNESQKLWLWWKIEG